jgi:hypothetical protein
MPGILVTCDVNVETGRMPHVEVLRASYEFMEVKKSPASFAYVAEDAQDHVCNAHMNTE